MFPESMISSLTQLIKMYENKNCYYPTRGSIKWISQKHNWWCFSCIFSSFLPPPLRDSVNPQGWRQCYNQHDVESSLAKVHMVGFNEKLVSKNTIFHMYSYTYTKVWKTYAVLNHFLQMSSLLKIGYIWGARGNSRKLGILPWKL